MKKFFFVGLMIGVMGWISGVVFAQQDQPAPMMNEVAIPQGAPEVPDVTTPEEAPAVEEAPVLEEAPVPEEEAPVGEELKYSFGTVVSVGNNQVTVLEYDDDMEKEVEVVYNVNAQTQFKNVNALDELAKDDSIELFYNEKDGNRVASQIIKEILTQDTDTDENQ